MALPRALGGNSCLWVMTMALITLTGFDLSLFDWLVQEIKVYYDKYTPFTQDGSIHPIGRVG